MISETTTTAGGEGVGLTGVALNRALQRAYSLGQRFWQQADSEFYSQNAKAGITVASFNKLVADTLAELATLRAANKRLTGLLEKIVATNLLTLADSGSLQDEARAALTSNAAAAANGEME